MEYKVNTLDDTTETIRSMTLEDIIDYLKNNEIEEIVIKKAEKILSIKNQSCIFNKNGLQIKKKEN